MRWIFLTFKTLLKSTALFWGGVIYEDVVACILMHDRFHIAHDVAHGFIEFPAIRGLTQCNSECHSSHQRFLISCNKLHATRKITSSAVDFSGVLNVVEIYCAFWRFNMLSVVNIRNYALKFHVFHFERRKRCLVLPADP